MRANLSSEDKDKLQIIIQWKENCKLALEFHAAILSKFWEDIKINGGESRFNVPLYFNIVQDTNTVDREMKVVIRKAEIIEELINSEASPADPADIRQLLSDFFNDKNKYIIRWEEMEDQLEVLAKEFFEEPGIADSSENFFNF